MGAGYYVGASHGAMTDRGFLSVQAGVHNNQLEDSLKAILAEFRRLKEELVSEKELKKTKEYLIGHLKLGLEKSDEVAEFFGGQEVLRKPIETPEEMIVKINKVTAQDIQKLAKEIFTNARLNLTLVGPTKPNIAKILRI